MNNQYRVNTFTDFQSYVQSAYPQARIVGDRKFARAFITEKQVIAYWHGKVGIIEL